MLHIQTLGGLSVHGAEPANGAAAQRRNLVLLALVAASPTGISRDKLLGFLCPEMPEDRARNTLRQRIYALRHGLGADELFLGTADVRLNPAVVSVDLWEFEAAIASGDLQRAGRVYRGPFLDGIFLRDLPELEAWIEDTRADLSRKAMRVYTALAAAATTSGDHQGAIDAWRRLVSLEPASATSAIGLINALAEAGDAAGAIDHYRAYSALLHEQYELEPDPRVTAAANAIRNSMRSTGANGPGNGARNGGNGKGNGRRMSPAHGVAEQASAAPSSMDAPQPVVAAPQEEGRPRVARRKTLGVVAVLAVLAAVLVRGAGAAFGFGDGKPAATNPARVLVLPFDNDTEIEPIDATANAATAAVIHELAHARVAEVVDAQNSMRASARSSDTLTSLQLAQQRGAGSILQASLRLVGDSIVVEARITDAVSGAVAQAIAPVVVHRDSATRLIEPLSSRVSGAIAATQDPFFRGFTGGGVELPNKEAYGEFRSGILAYMRYDEEDALDHIKRAFQLDTGFVQAALWISESFVGDSAKWFRDYVRAHASKLTPLDKAYLEFQEAYMKGDRDLEGAYRASGEMVRLAPDSWIAKVTHARMAMHTRRYNEAARLYGDIDPKTPGLAVKFFWNAGEAFHLAHQHTRELENYEVGISAFPEDFYVCVSSVQAIAALGSLADIGKRIKKCTLQHPGGQRQGVIAGLAEAATVLRVHGQSTQSDSLWNEHVRLAEAEWKADTAGRVRLGEAYYVAGRYEQALPLLVAEAERKDRKERPMGPELTRVAVAAAKAGDTATVRKYEDRIFALRKGKAAPLAMLAEIAAAQNHDDEAMKLIQEAANRRLLVNQVYGKRVYQRLWKRPEWKELFESRQ